MRGAKGKVPVKPVPCVLTVNSAKPFCTVTEMCGVPLPVSTSAFGEFDAMSTSHTGQSQWQNPVSCYATLG